MTDKSSSKGNKGHVKNKIKPALLVIDVQNKYLKMIQPRDKEVAIFFINLLIDLFRKNDFPIIRIYHLDKEASQDSDPAEFEYPDSILIQPGDPKIIKTYSDAFNKTELDRVLREKGSNSLFLCGLSAVGCVLASFIGAHNHDYRAFILKDAIMSHNTDYTRNVEAMFDAISYDAVKLILESC
jgi:nicotinamidase-related amidase